MTAGEYADVPFRDQHGAAGTCAIGGWHSARDQDPTTTECTSRIIKTGVAMVRAALLEAVSAWARAHGSTDRV